MKLISFAIVLAYTIFIRAYEYENRTSTSVDVWNAPTIRTEVEFIETYVNVSTSSYIVEGPKVRVRCYVDGTSYRLNYNGRERNMDIICRATLPLHVQHDENVEKWILNITNSVSYENYLPY